MRAFIFVFVLLLCANGFPINSNRVKRSEEDECKEDKKYKDQKDEDKKDETSKNENEKDLDINEISRRSCALGRHFVGSNLFDGARKICFTLDEVNLLIARRDFEMMLPQNLPQELLDDTSAADVLRYFYYGLYLLDSIEDCEIRHKIEKAYYDTMGGFFFNYLLPVVKFSYYAGKLDLKTVRGVAALYHRSRIFLNTNGNGWRPPIRDPTVEFTNIRIEPLKLPKIDPCLRDKIACVDLDLSTAANDVEIVDDNMIVALPKLMLEDPEGFLNNIWFPFSRKRTFNLRSCKSAFVFVKFYRSVSLCYEQKGMDRKIFDHKFRQWVVENVKVHLGDEVFYPGLGGILNVYETLRGFCNNKSVEKRHTLKVENTDLALIEERSCSYGNVVEGANLRLRKRALNNEELEYVNFIAQNMPIDSEDKRADEWIKKFDESTLNECCGEKVTIIKCKPKGCCPKPKCKSTCATPCEDPCSSCCTKYWFLAFLCLILMLLGACWFGMKHGDEYWEVVKDIFNDILDEFICSKITKKRGKQGRSPKKKSPRKNKSPRKRKKRK